MSGEWQLDSLESVLMRRDGMSRDAAQDVIKEMRDRAVNGEDPEDLLYEIGLEPDYVWDIIG
jgi:predicted PP-loop superfamily ATPase